MAFRPSYEQLASWRGGQRVRCIIARGRRGPPSSRLVEGCDEKEGPWRERRYWLERDAVRTAGFRVLGVSTRRARGPDRDDRRLHRMRGVRQARPGFLEPSRRCGDLRTTGQRKHNAARWASRTVPIAGSSCVKSSRIDEPQRPELGLRSALLVGRSVPITSAMPCRRGGVATARAGDEGGHDVGGVPVQRWRARS
jgi:hypothetical protein